MPDSLRVFVVDDEDMIREGIRNALEKDASRFVLAGEAPDGEMALPLLQELKPDVLITDIRMPFMDGLELAEHVRRTMPWMRVIILSGHDEFRYAQRAIGLGVEDYLLKPITSEKLLDTLTKVARDIVLAKAEMLNLQAEGPDPGEYEILVEHFLNQLLSGALSVAEARTRAGELGVPFDSYKEYAVAFADLSHFTRLEQKQIVNVAHQNLDTYPDLLVFSREGPRLVFLTGAVERGHALDQMYGAMQAFLHELLFYLQLETPIGVGMAVARLSELPSAWQSAKIAYESHAGVKSGTIYSFAPSRSGNGTRTESSGETKTFDFSDEQSLIDVLGYLEPGDRDAFIDKYYRTISDQDVQSLLYRYYLTMNLTATVSRLLADIGHDLKASIDFVDQPDEVFKQTETFESTKRYAAQLLDIYLTLRVSGHYRYDAEIREARAYIQTHFPDAELSLQQVANHVGYSPNHFSTIFSQETGETLVGYLTKVRLEQARRMLVETDLKLRDIAERCGYSEAQYFSYQFKKRYGMPPSEYRATFFFDKNL